MVSALDVKVKVWCVMLILRLVDRPPTPDDDLTWERALDAPRALSLSLSLPLSPSLCVPIHQEAPDSRSPGSLHFNLFLKRHHLLCHMSATISVRVPELMTSNWVAKFTFFFKAREKAGWERQKECNEKATGMLKRGNDERWRGRECENDNS
jgi:hypothetical protein